MTPVFIETTVGFIDDNGEQIFIKRRIFRNAGEPVFFIRTENSKYEAYTHKLNNGLTLEQQFDEGIRRIK